METPPVLTETMIVEAANQEIASEAAMRQESEHLAQEVLGLREDVSLALAVQQVEQLAAA